MLKSLAIKQPCFYKLRPRSRDILTDMGIQNFLLKQYANWKMKDVPKGQRDMMMELVQKNPDLFKKIGDEVERRKKGGESEMKAAMEVMKKYRAEVAELMQK